jgi:hypothetical protein
MPPRECAVDDCGRKTHAGGMCASHYHRLKRYGDPLVVRYHPGQLCAVPDCERVSRANGLCQPHYIRQRNGQVLDTPLAPRSRSHRRPCASWPNASKCWAWSRIKAMPRGSWLSSRRTGRPPTYSRMASGWKSQGPVGDPSMFGL